MLQFRLIQTQVRTLNCGPKSSEVKDKVLKYSALFNEERPKEFAVVFYLGVDLADDLQLNLDYLTVFETSEEITDEFRNSHFPHVNAPAVSYPFVRAFVSQFATLAGFAPIILPIHNFTVRADKSLHEGE